MSEEDTRYQELRSDLVVAANHAQKRLDEDHSPDAYIELYLHGFIATNELEHFVWCFCYDNPESSNHVLKYFEGNEDEHVSQIPMNIRSRLLTPARLMNRFES